MELTPAIKAISEYSYLLAAYRRAEKHCKRSGERAAFVYQLPFELQRIQNEIRTGQYRFGPYSTKIVVDPKRRLIHKAPFRDRVVHQAIFLFVEEEFERRMIFHTYACRKNKGTSAASKQIFRWTRNYNYAIKLDMAKYFSNVDHDRLMEKLRPCISDSGLIGFIESLVESFSPGIPIGNLTSQLFANWYLNEVDHYIKRVLKVKSYARYMDDLILFSDSKQELWTWTSKIKEFVEAKEKLFIPEKKTILISTSKGGVPFLGYWFFKDKMPRLQQRTLISQKKRLRKFNRGELNFNDYQTSSAGWWGHASYGVCSKLADDIGVRNFSEEFKSNCF